jgi:MarR family transcriptional regulator for hemolysin
VGVVAEPSPTATESPEPPVTNLAWLLSQASYVLSTQLTAALEKVGVSPRAYCVLSTAMTGEFTQIELAHAVGLDKTTMVVTIDELEAAGLAKRRLASEDRRARIVAVTKAGERKVAQAEEIVDRVHSDVLAELPAGERKAFVKALTRLVGGRLSSAAPCSKPVRRRAPRG